MIACSVKNIFTGKSISDLNENNKLNIKEKNQTPNKVIYLEFLLENALLVKRVVKEILSSSYWVNRYKAPVKLILKQSAKINIR